jgi:hypothetical protein
MRTKRKSLNRLAASIISFLFIMAFAVSGMAQRKNLLFECGFEKDRCGANAEIEGGSLTLVDSPTRVGKGALKVSCSGVRAELKGSGSSSSADAGGPNISGGKERWFAVSIFIPSEFKGNSKGTAMFFQVHERPDSCEDWRSPPLNFGMRGEEMWITVKWDANACSTGGGVPAGGGEKQIWKDAASKYKGRWSDWVIHTIWSYKDDGLTEAWVDGKKVVEYRGKNAYNDSKPYYWKSGMYKRWDGLVTHYMDELRIGNDKATYADVAPGNGNGNPTPEPELTHTIQLQKNWNLISLPINPSDTDIADVLAPINGLYAAVHAYDGKEYESYYLSNTAESTLKKMEAGRGYWIFMNQAASLQIKGTTAGKSITFGQDWNLVGYNSTTSMSATQALASTGGKVAALYSYNNATNTYEVAQTLQPGTGYWLYATEGGSWALP